MKHFYLLPVLLCASCAINKPVPSIASKDSVRIEVRYERVIVHDTAYIELPAIEQSVITADTTSHLENEFALSDAVISGGYLYHSLHTRQGTHAYPVETITIYRDSIIYRDRVVEELKVEEVKKPLSWWVKLQIGGFWIALAALAWRYRKQIARRSMLRA